VRRLRRLLQKRSARWAERVFVAEGVEASRCGLEAGAVPESVFVTWDSVGQAEVASVVATAGAAGARTYQLARGVAERVADTVTPHPVLSVFPMLDRPLEDLGHPEVAVVCVDVRDPGNAGTVLRTCDAAGVGAVIFAGGTVDPYNPKTVRSSAGSIFHVPLVVAADVGPVLARLRADGLTVYGTAAAGTDYAAADLTVPVGIVLGNEAAGLPAELLAELAGPLAVPMAGRAESLNVAMACAVLCFEANRQRRLYQPGGSAGGPSMPGVVPSAPARP
jgi:TrmH family RNA methyltransferase